MNTPQDNHDRSDHAQRLHEQLCAYVFGELEGDDRAALEAELERSPELQAEHDRLKATVAFVQDALPPEALTPETHAILTKAASTPPGAGRLFRLVPRMAAAAVVVIAVGFGLKLMITSEPKTHLQRDEPLLQARVESPPEKSAETWYAFDEKGAPPAAERGRGVVEELQDEARRGLAGLGYAGDDGGEEVVAEALGVLPTQTPNPAPATKQAPSLGKSAPPAPTGGPSSPGPPARDAALGEPLLRDVEIADNYGAATGNQPAPTVAAVVPGAEPGTPELKLSRLRLGTALKLETESPFDAVTFNDAWGIGGGGGAARPERELASIDEALDAAVFAFDALDEEAEVDLDGEADLAAGRYFGRRKEKKPSAGYLADSRPYFATADDLEREANRIIGFCRRRPNETPSMMFYRYWGDNPFESTATDSLSTFAADVDTASYALARRYLRKGLVPEKAQIRTEEFLNYFDADVAAPTEDVFGIRMDLAPSYFGGDGEPKWLLRVVLRGQEVDKFERQPLALTFVVDVSGSMKEGGRMELVKHALRLLVGEMSTSDAIAIVAFSNEARMILPMTSAANRGVIESAIYGLNPDGGTNAEAGLRMGYEVAAAELTPNASNRVVLLSDGVANIGQTDQDRIAGDVAKRRELGIYLNTVGVGMNNHNDTFLEQMAVKGDGLCNYIDTPEEAQRALVENFTGAFQPIARDVKIQVEFDPSQVESYRRLGYENRAIADADFRRDEVDAGEVNAGHQVTALFELTRFPASVGTESPLATVRVRYKPPFAVDKGLLDEGSRQGAEEASEIVARLHASQAFSSFAGTPLGYRRATLVAQVAEVLRRSVHARDNDFDNLLAAMVTLDRELQDPEFSELCALLRDKRDLIKRTLHREDDLRRAVDELCRNRYLNAQLEDLQREELADQLDQLERQNAELEALIRELLRQRMGITEEAGAEKR
jgi:Ca-activated chloride channel family protein